MAGCWVRPMVSGYSIGLPAMAKPITPTPSTRGWYSVFTLGSANPRAFWSLGEPLGTFSSLWGLLGAEHPGPGGSLLEPVGTCGVLFEPMGACGTLLDPVRASGNLYSRLGLYGQVLDGQTVREWRLPRPESAFGCARPESEWPNGAGVATSKARIRVRVCTPRVRMAKRFGSCDFQGQNPR